MKLTFVSETVTFVICNHWILWVSWSSSSCDGIRLQFNHGGIGMNNRLLNCLIAGALGTALALASPALAFRGGGGGGGMRGGGLGGGMHCGGLGGGMHGRGMGRGMHLCGRKGGNPFRGHRFAAAACWHSCILT